MAPDAKIAAPFSLMTITRAASLSEALGLCPGEVVSLVGGGGKTSLMFRLAHELAAAGRRVISTTTTRILPPEPEQSECVIIEENDDKLIAMAREALQRCSHVTLARLKPDDGKLKGVLPETVDRLNGLRLADCIVNEADGAARQPIKAPNATEPVIPSCTSLVVALAGVEAVGRALSPEVAFRTFYITQLTGLREGQPITVEAVATLLTHPHGIIQHTPPGSRIIPFINKVTPADVPVAEALAAEVLRRGHPQIARVVFGSVQRPDYPLTVVTAKTS